MAATTTTTTTTTSMKLLIDAKAQRVLFAEAGKDVIDFLFSILALPVSTAVELLGKDSIAGSVGNLYASVEELNDTYVSQGVAKSALLRPASASTAVSSNSSPLRLPLPEPPSGKPKAMYTCNTYSYSSSTTYSNILCRTVTDVCGSTCDPALASIAAGKGFVQGIVTYTVMDDLTVTPTSAVTQLNTLAATDIGALEEKTVQVGYNEGLAILKASLQSNTVLTDVFLGNNKACATEVDNMD